MNLVHPDTTSTADCLDNVPFHRWLYSHCTLLIWLTAWATCPFIADCTDTALCWSALLHGQHAFHRWLYRHCTLLIWLTAWTTCPSIADCTGFALCWSGRLHGQRAFPSLTVQALHLVDLVDYMGNVPFHHWLYRHCALLIWSITWATCLSITDCTGTALSWSGWLHGQHDLSSLTVQTLHFVDLVDCMDNMPFHRWLYRHCTLLIWSIAWATCPFSADCTDTALFWYGS